MEGRLAQMKVGGGARLVVLLHYDLPEKHPSSLPQHVEVELRKHCEKNENMFRVTVTMMNTNESKLE